MKTIAVLAVLFATTAVWAAQERQMNPPRDLWCRDMMIVEGAVQYCMAYTLEQCLASRGSPNERCYRNPRYDPRYRR